MLCDNGVILSVRILKWAKFLPVYASFIKILWWFCAKRFWLYRCCWWSTRIQCVKWKRYTMISMRKWNEREAGERKEHGKLWVNENRSHEIYKRSKCLILTLSIVHLSLSSLLSVLSLSKMKYSEQTIKQFMSLGMEWTKTLIHRKYCLNLNLTNRKNTTHIHTHQSSKPMGKALQRMNGK